MDDWIPNRQEMAIAMMAMQGIDLKEERKRQRKNHYQIKMLLAVKITVYYSEYILYILLYKY